MLSDPSEREPHRAEQPLWAGARVRWTSPVDPSLQAEGTITDLHPSPDGPVYVKIEEVYGDWSRCGGAELIVGRVYGVGRSLVRRIPHPGPAAPAVPGDGAYVRWTSPLDPASWVEGTVVGEPSPWGSCYLVEVCVAEVHGGCQTFHEARVGRSQAVIGSRADLARDLRVVPHPPPPSEVLYDGLTAVECHAYWQYDRRRVEQGQAPVYGLTRDQVEAGRARWQSQHSPAWSAELRLLVEAGEERDRASCVRVVLPDEELATANAPAPTPDEVWDYHQRTGAC